MTSRSPRVEPGTAAASGEPPAEQSLCNNQSPPLRAPVPRADPLS